MRRIQYMLWMLLCFVLAHVWADLHVSWPSTPVEWVSDLSGIVALFTAFKVWHYKVEKCHISYDPLNVRH